MQWHTITGELIDSKNCRSKVDPVLKDLSSGSGK